MSKWDSISVNNFIVPVICLHIGLGNNVLIKLLNFIDSNADKLSKVEELVHNTLVILNQVISKRCQDHQIWDINYGVMS